MVRAYPRRLQCKNELERLESLYRDSLKMLIEEARVTLLQQWDRLHVSKEERVNIQLPHARLVIGGSLSSAATSPDQFHGLRLWRFYRSAPDGTPGGDRKERTAAQHSWYVSKPCTSVDCLRAAHIIARFCLCHRPRPDSSAHSRPRKDLEGEDQLRAGNIRPEAIAVQGTAYRVAACNS